MLSAIRAGQIADCLTYFDALLSQGLQPSLDTYIRLLYACQRADDEPALIRILSFLIQTDELPGGSANLLHLPNFQPLKVFTVVLQHFARRDQWAPVMSMLPQMYQAGIRRMLLICCVLLFEIQHLFVATPHILALLADVVLFQILIHAACQHGRMGIAELLLYWTQHPPVSAEDFAVDTALENQNLLLSATPLNKTTSEFVSTLVPRLINKHRASQKQAAQSADGADISPLLVNPDLLNPIARLYGVRGDVQVL